MTLALEIVKKNNPTTQRKERQMIKRTEGIVERALKMYIKLICSVLSVCVCVCLHQNGW